MRSWFKQVLGSEVGREKAFTVLGDTQQDFVGTMIVLASESRVTLQTEKIESNQQTKSQKLRGTRAPIHSAIGFIISSLDMNLKTPGRRKTIILDRRRWHDSVRMK
jgi:hypothetical protein